MSFLPPAEFGPFIKHFRESKQATKAYVIKKTGITRKTLDRWENGDVQRIRDDTLEAFANCFDLSEEQFKEEFKAYRERLALDTVQAAHCPPTNDTTVPSPPRNPTQAPTPSRNERGPQRKRRIISLVSVALLIIMALTTILLMQFERDKPATITGQVLCTDNEPVEGVWVEAVNGGSGWADKQITNSNGSELAFSRDLSSGGAYNLHVGCGGSEKNWKHINETEYGSGTIQDHNFHLFTCQDAPPGSVYGACQLKH